MVILFNLQIGNLYLRMWFGVAEDFAVNLPLDTPFIDSLT